jgi:hypothetical protein
MIIPLLIGPQGTWSRWLKEHLKKSLVVMRFDQPNFVQSLRAAVSQGYQVIIENIGNKIDHVIPQSP